MALRVIDLSDDEQAVYQAIIAQQPVVLGQLVAELGMPRRTLRTVVDRLQVKGLIIHTPGEFNQFTAAPPDIALEALLIGKEEQLERARLEAVLLARQHRRRSAAHDPTPLVEVISGTDTVVQRFQQAQSACRNEIRIIDQHPCLSGDQYAAFFLQQELVERGVRLRGIYDASRSKSRDQLPQDVDDGVSSAVDVRILPSTPIKLLLADNQLALLPLLTRPGEIDSVVIVHPSALLVALSVLFEHLWERALPLVLPEGDTTVSPKAPTRADLRLLSVLKVGMSDEIIANRLGISRRTMQRQLQALMERLDARTRFQAALRAVALGWLPAPSHVMPVEEPDVAAPREIV